MFYRLGRQRRGRALIDQALALVSPDDATLRRDAERLAGVGAERAGQAAAYFADNAERWDEIRSLYISEAAVEAAILRGGRARGRSSGWSTSAPAPAACSPCWATGRGARSGLDLSRQMLNIARSNVAGAGLPAASCATATSSTRGLADGEADLVVVHQVLHYLGEPAAAVAEAARLVAPGGRLLIVDFAPHDLEFLRAEHRHRRLGFFDDEIERWLAAAGLGEVATVTLPPAGPRRPDGQDLERRARRTGACRRVA